MARESKESSGHPSRLGNLRVFLPAFLSWGSVVAWLWAVKLDRFWDAAPAWARPAFDWTVLGAAVLAAVAFVVVTVRVRIARHWFPVVLNLSTIGVAYVAISMAVVTIRVRSLIAETNAKLERLEERQRVIDDALRNVR